MLTSDQIISPFFRSALLVAMLLSPIATQLGAQHSVAVLTGVVGDREKPLKIELASTGTESFTLVRNLIAFEAEVDGRSGRYILDTGAPSLIINNRGKEVRGTPRTAVGSGGKVGLTDQRVQQFVMGNRSVKNYWAVALDLRSLESRTEQRIDGFVGYDLINQGELRIDYGRGVFSLLKSQRRPVHGGATPLHTIAFHLDGHLPVVQITIDGDKYNFIIDTGAGANLIDPSIMKPGATTASGNRMNIQGLDGRPADHEVVRLAPDNILSSADLVAMDLHHLAHDPAFPIAGILGSAFLRDYTLGIDYRRRKIHLWALNQLVR